MNLCIFGGNFVRDPELKKVGPESTSVANFTIAVNRTFSTRNGEKKKDVTYLDCEIWDSGADTITRNCKKGDNIIVYTSARNESWTDSTTNQKRSRVKFRVDRFEFVPGTRRHTETQETAPPAPESEPNEDAPSGEDDIPF